jgi:nucleotide-binding universal stress UspA family protein
MQTNRLKFRMIVVATDMKNTASSTLSYALAIARQHGSTLILVHVVDPVGYAFPSGMPASLFANKSAREELTKIEGEIRGQGIPVHSIVASGVICERILQAVKDHRADLLILGTRAKADLGRVALGTVARQLLAKAPCPILTIPQNVDALLPSAGRWGNVLLATDFSDASLAALSYAHQITHQQLIAFHAERCLDEIDRPRHLERLRFLAPLNESHTVPVEHIVRSGDAGELIAEHAEKFHAELVVLGSPTNELSEEDFHTSTVLQVISHVMCPVLCVPSPRALSAEQPIHEVASV